MSVTEVGLLLVASVGIGWPVAYLFGVTIERERNEQKEERQNVRPE